jgi:hypothetical protein
MMPLKPQRSRRCPSVLMLRAETSRGRLLPRAAAVLMGLLSAAVPAADPVETMAQVMARMMEAMGLLGDGPNAPVPPPFPLGGVGAATGTPSGVGRRSSLPDPEQASAQVADLLGDMTETLSRAAGFRGTDLDGIWEGRDGGLLIIRGHRFRLQAAQGGHLEGLIQQRGNRVALYEPSGDTVRPYEFAEQQGRLVLRDPKGRVYLYRQLWLDEGG